jgi:hypothetical protein
VNPGFCARKRNPQLARKLLSAQTIYFSQRKCFTILRWQRFNYLESVGEELLAKFVITGIITDFALEVGKNLGSELFGNNLQTGSEVRRYSSINNDCCGTKRSHKKDAERQCWVELRC